jgi:hypothetical protein
MKEIIIGVAVLAIGSVFFAVLPFILQIIGVVLAIVVVVAIFGAVFGK